MTKDEAMKLAKDACPYFDEISKGAFYDGFLMALDQLPYATKMIEPIVAGAVYDFAGFITTRDKVIRVGATADAAPVADLVKEWANRRSLSLEDAAVGSWGKELAEPPNSTTDVVEPVAWMYVNKDGEVGDIGYGVGVFTRKDPDIKLLYEAPPRPAQDLIVGYAENHDIDRAGHDFWVSRQPGKNTVPLYLYGHPPKIWQGLTDEEIAEAAKRFRWDDKYAFESAACWAEEMLKDKNRG